MAATSVWHFGLTVSDLDNAVAFYRDVLGMQERHRQTQRNEYTALMTGQDDAHIEIAQMRIPDAPCGPSQHHLELIEWKLPPGRAVASRDFPDVTTAHLALEVDDIDAIALRAATFQCQPISDIQDITAGINAGGRVVFMRDPDGSFLELVQPPR